MATRFYLAVQGMPKEKRIDSRIELKLLIVIIPVKIHKEANKLKDENREYKAIHDNDNISK